MTSPLEIPEADHRLLAALQKAVTRALERKTRLGQYAVVWFDGQPGFIGPNPPAKAGLYSTHSIDPSPGVAEPGDDD